MREGKAEESFLRDSEKAHLYLRSKLSGPGNESQGKGDKRRGFDKEKWSRSMGTVRLLCVVVFFSSVKNDAIIVIQLHVTRSIRLHPYPTPSSLPLSPPAPPHEPVGNVFLRSCAPVWSWNVKIECITVLKSRSTLLKKAVCLQNQSHREVKQMWRLTEKRQNPMDPKSPHAFFNEHEKMTGTSLFPWVTQQCEAFILSFLFLSISLNFFHLLITEHHYC